METEFPYLITIQHFLGGMSDFEKVAQFTDRHDAIEYGRQLRDTLKDQSPIADRAIINVIDLTSTSKSPNIATHHVTIKEPTRDPALF